MKKRSRKRKTEEELYHTESTTPPETVLEKQQLVKTRTSLRPKRKQGKLNENKTENQVKTKKIKAPKTHPVVSKDISSQVKQWAKEAILQSELFTDHGLNVANEENVLEGNPAPKPAPTLPEREKTDLKVDLQGELDQCGAVSTSSKNEGKKLFFEIVFVQRINSS
jgi:hypothetical protein